MASNKKAGMSRRQEAERLCQRHPDRIPVIVNRANREKNVPDIDKHQFLVPKDLTFSQFMFIIRKRLKLTAEQALFFFTETNELPPSSAAMDDLYVKFKDADGFLVLVYRGENTFGRN